MVLGVSEERNAPPLTAPAVGGPPRCGGHRGGRDAGHQLQADALARPLDAIRIEPLRNAPCEGQRLVNPQSSRQDPPPHLVSMPIGSNTEERPLAPVYWGTTGLPKPFTTNTLSSRPRGSSVEDSTTASVSRIRFAMSAQ